jgi:hypothetical protein
VGPHLLSKEDAKSLGARSPPVLSIGRWTAQAGSVQFAEIDVLYARDFFVGQIPKLTIGAHQRSAGRGFRLLGEFAVIARFGA